MIEDERKKIKEMYLEYLEDVPVHKWASKYCQISENTSKNWRDEDKDFCDACEERISQFVRRTAKRAKPEFQLERLLRDDFGEKKQVDVTTGGKPIQPIVDIPQESKVVIENNGVPENIGNAEDPTTD